MGDREFMRELCGEGRQFDISEPFRVHYRGKDWDCATNSHCLLLMAEPCQFESCVGAPNGEDIANHIPHELAPTRESDMAQIAAWIVAVDYPETCHLCPGEDCRQCGGTSVPVVRSRFFGKVIDRRLLKRFTAHLSGPVRVATEADGSAPVALYGEGWILYVMPMAVYACDTVPADEFPARAA